MITALTISVDLDDEVELQNFDPQADDRSIANIVEEFHRQFSAGEATPVDYLTGGIDELDQYFSEQMLTNTSLYSQLKVEFEALTEALTGQYYLWGFEDDYSLVFISDDEGMELGVDSQCCPDLWELEKF